METPSEWAKRFNQKKAGEETGPPKPEAETVNSPAAVADFPNEPFQCPACGQLLAPACRVCVACKHTIDPAEIARPRDVALPVAHAPSTERRPEPVRYPWQILIAVIGIGVMFGLICLALFGEQKGPLVIQALPILTGIWVFLDAFRRRIPRPMRWAVGTMLLLAVVFPWYLARRGKPESPVPFVEAEVGPVTRFLLFALLLLFLIGLIINIVKGPPPSNTPAPTPKAQPSSGSSPARITDLHMLKMGGWRKWQGEALPGLRDTLGTYAEINAPSDAWQT